MNKYLLLTVISMLFMGTVFSQQKVKDRTVEGNTLPNSNAILELESTNKGLLHTRVMLTGSSDAAPLSQHVAGMMVYNTANTNDVVPGIYYNDGTKWVLAGAVANGANGITYDPISYEITYIDDDGNPQTIDLSEVIKANETATTLVDHGDGTYTYTNEAGATTLIDVPGNVADNFEDIIGNPNVQALLSEFIKGEMDGIVTFDGVAFSYVDGDGNPQVLTLSALVQANETVTTLIGNGNGTYSYTNEDGTVVTFDANTSTVTDNGDGTYTVTNGDGTTVTIDVAGDVLTELQDNTSNIHNEVLSLINNEIIANSDALVDNGDGTFTHTAVDGTVVTFDVNTSTVTDNGDGTYTVTNADGTTVTIDVAGDVLTELQDNTSDIYTEIQNIITAGSDALVDNGDGTFTHTAADGTVVTFDANTSTVTDNGDGTYTITNADGTTATIDVAGDVLTELQDNTSDIYTEIQNIITAGGDALVDNGDGTFTHTAADGTVVTFDANTSTVTDNGDGTYTVTNADGTTVTIDVAGDVLTELQDNTSDIHNEVLSLINNEIIANSDALVDNGDGTFTHTAADGTVVTFDANTSTVTDNGDGTYTITNADGTTATIDTNADTSGYDNTASGLTADNVQDALDEIAADLAGTTDILVDNGDGTFTHTASDGTIVTFDANTSTVTDNGDGTYTITNADGTTATIDVAGDVLTELQDNTSDIYTEIQNMITADSDALVDNGDGTFTHTAADGTIVTFDANTSTVTDNGDGTYTITNADGTTVIVDTNADTSGYDNTTSGLTADNVQDALDEIAADLAATTDVLVDNGDGTFTHTASDGTVVTFDANTSTVTDNGDGTYTVTNADGTTVTIDTNADTSGYDNTTSGLAADNVQDALDEIAADLAGTTDALVDNGDGTLTHTAVDGTIVTFDANTSTVTDNGDGTYTVTNGDGTTVTIDTNADTSGYDNTTSGLAADNVQDALDEIAADLAGTTDALVDNGDGTFTHTAVDGTIVTFNANTSTVTDNGDGTYTITNADGTTVTIDVAGDVLTELQDNTSDIYTEIQNILTAGSDALVDNGDGTFTHTAADGTAVTFDANTSTVTDNGDGTYTITNGDGTTVTIDVAGDVLTELQDNTSDIYTEIQNIITAGSDALVDNGDGTFTHTAADGTVVTFDANTSTVTDNGDGTYTITNADGTTVTIDVAGDVLTELQDNTSNIHNEVLSLINNEIIANSDALVDNGDGTFTHTAADGTVVTFDANTSTVTDNGDGTYTITNADGTTATIDVAGDVLTELQDNTSNIHNEVLSLINNEIIANSDALVDNGDGTFTHTAADGTVVTFDANTSTVTDNGDGTYTVTNGDGTTVTIDVAGDVLTELQDNTSDIHNEVLSLISNEIIANSDALVDNGDGTFTHTAVDGTVVTFDANTSTVTDNGDGTYTITNADGTTVTIDVAGDVLTELQDNTSDIHNEVLSLINNEIIANSDALVDNGDGTFTHTAVDGTVVTFDANTSTVTDNGDGTYTVTNADGTTVTIDVPGDVLTELQDNTSDIYNEVVNVIETNETTTTLAINAGSLTYTNEDGTNPAVNLISADADNTIVAGTDGALFVPVTPQVNLYNSDGAIPEFRTVSGTENWLNFQGTTGSIQFNGNNIKSLSNDDNQINMYFSDNTARLYADGPTMDAFEIGMTVGFTQPLNFVTNGSTRLSIDGTGEIQYVNYPNTRDDSDDTPVSNILYTDGDGNLLSAPVANLAVEPWQVQATTDQATDNTQDIYQTGSVAIGTDAIPNLTVGGDDLTSTVKLHVDGNITTSGKLYTTNSMYADYVFEKYFNGHSDLNTTYELASLNDVKSFIKKNHHLPGVTRIADLSKSAKGYTFDLTSLSIQQLEKIEELFIHTIEQQELLDKQEEQLKRQQAELDELKDRLAKIERLLNQQ